MKCNKIEFVRGKGRGGGPNVEQDENFWCDLCNDYPESVIVKTFYREHKMRTYVVMQQKIASIYIVKCHGSKFVIDDQEDVKRIYKTLFGPYLTL